MAKYKFIEIVLIVTGASSSIFFLFQFICITKCAIREVKVGYKNQEENEMKQWRKGNEVIKTRRKSNEAMKLVSEINAFVSCTVKHLITQYKCYDIQIKRWCIRLGNLYDHFPLVSILLRVS